MECISFDCVVTRLLKDICVLINESTIKCNDYLGVLMKLEEIVRTQAKKVVFCLNYVILRVLYIHCILYVIINI